MNSALPYFAPRATARRWLTHLLPAALLALVLNLTAQAQFTEVQKLTAPETGRLGSGVAVEGNLMVVGDESNSTDAEGNNSLNQAGAVFVYEREGGSWVLKAKLVSPHRAEERYFGRYVAVSGGTIAIGNWLDFLDANGENSLPGAGSVCLYEKVNGVWTFVQKLLNSDRSRSDRLGLSLAFEGNTLMAGSESDTDAAGLNPLPDAGAVYVFEKVGGAWTQTQKLVAFDRQPYDDFSTSIEVSGNTLAVGARDNVTDASGANPLRFDVGAAYVFEKVGGTWTQTQKLVAFDRQNSDRFGRAVSVSGSTIAVAATQNDLDANGENRLGAAGAAYVFVKTGGTWALQAKLVAADRTSGADFGTDVDVVGNTLVVGGESETDANNQNPIPNAGAVYVFTRSGTTWTQTQKLVASDRDGGPTGFANDLGQNGSNIVGFSGTTLVVGAAAPANAAYVFELCSPTFNSTPTVSGVPVCAGGTFRLSFTAQASPCPPPGGLVAQLSDATGNFGNPVSLGAVSPGINSLTLPAGTLPGTGYRVRVVLGGAPSVGSTASAPFTVRGPAFASAPSVSGDNKCAGQTVRLSFTTTGCPFPAGNAFTVELSDATGANFAPIPGTVTPRALNNVAIPANTPAGTGYKLRIVSSNPEAVSAASGNFRVKACGNTREAAPDPEYSGLRVVVGPNPSPEGRLGIVVSGAEGQALRVELFNGLGQSLRAQVVEKAAENEVLDWDVSRQPAGLYLLRVSNGPESKTVKVLH